MRPDDDRRTRFAWIGERLAVGPFATFERAQALVDAGVTDLLNVSDTEGLFPAEAFGFRTYRWIPIADHVRIPNESVLACLDALGEMLQGNDARVYLHCLAGWNRSPTIAWLFLIACGEPPESARLRIESVAPDSVAGHPLLIDAELIAKAVAEGRARGWRDRDIAALRRTTDPNPFESS